MKVEKLILKHVLLNALEHEGKAQEQAVVGKVIAEKPELKTKVKEVLSEVKKVVQLVNSWSLSRQQQELKKLRVRVRRKKAKKYELPPLPHARKGKVVTAFPPEPSKYPHLGHAKTALLNYLYAKRYKGKFICRMEDSDPTKVAKEFYQAFLEGLRWLKIKFDKLDFLSNHLEKFYQVTSTLVEQGKAYVCLCPRERVKLLRKEGKACEHRAQSVEENLRLWKAMLEGKIEEGKASLRLKIDPSHPNTAMRDPSLMRIIKAKHPRTGKKFRVWPLYDFGTALLDAWEGVTHRIRSKEFEARTELQNFIREACGIKKHPYILEIGRFELEGALTSGRKIRAMLASGELKGWDDPRLPTLVALKKRGFVPEAICKFLLSTGVTKAEAKLSWKALEAVNRSLIDKRANRYFAVLNPVKISVENAPPTKEVKAEVHPERKKIKRRIPVKLDEIYVEREDFEKLEGKEVSLMNLFTVNLAKKSNFLTKEIKLELPKIQWVSKPFLEAKLVLPTAEEKTILAEPALSKEKKDSLVQLVRIGFCRVEKAGEKPTLYFTHK